MDMLIKTVDKNLKRKYGFGCDGLKEVRFELTNRCGYKCFFCPRDQHKRRQGIMGLDDLGLAMNRIDEYIGEGFSGLVHLSGYGESFLDKEMPEKMAFIKRHWPNSRIFVTSTLGVNVSDEYLEKLAPYLDHIVVSFYSFNPKAYKELTKVDRFDLARKNIERLVEVRNRFNPDMLIQVKATMGSADEYMSEDPGLGYGAMLDWLERLGVGVKDNAHLHNYGSARVYQEPPEPKMCSIVKGSRSKILQVTWDLNIVPCCFDFNADMNMGSIKDNSLEDVLTGEFAEALVQAHIDRELSAFPICELCVSQGQVDTI